ncbi:hypothetical protein CI088_02975 [Enterococcus plantarum]|uniref:Uncharacterized protein n=1 Tax=Enterococcus plantarum TaxID=1077675 RepID=A0A2W3Z9Z9_9ENTE|nr:hypothetical protein CI088_02975 [Enterococcus plantarum]
MGWKLYNQLLTFILLICYNPYNTLSIKIKCEDKESIFQITQRESRLVGRDSENGRENGL